MQISGTQREEKKDVGSGRRQNPERKVAFLGRNQQAKVNLEVD